jgi:hypothetical protein
MTPDRSFVELLTAAAKRDVDARQAQAVTVSEFGRRSWFLRLADGPPT